MQKGREIKPAGGAERVAPLVSRRVHRSGAAFVPFRISKTIRPTGVTWPTGRVDGAPSTADGIG